MQLRLGGLLQDPTASPFPPLRMNAFVSHAKGAVSVARRLPTVLVTMDRVFGCASEMQAALQEGLVHRQHRDQQILLLSAQKGQQAGSAVTGASGCSLEEGRAAGCSRAALGKHARRTPPPDAAKSTTCQTRLHSVAQLGGSTACRQGAQSRVWCMHAGTKAAWKSGLLTQASACSPLQGAVRQAGQGPLVMPPSVCSTFPERVGGKGRGGCIKPPWRNLEAGMPSRCGAV